MNITMLRLRPLVRELKRIGDQLDRMNNIKEMELAYQGVHIRPPLADTSGAEPEIMYTNEQADAIREIQELLGQQPRPTEEEPA